VDRSAQSWRKPWPDLFLHAARAMNVDPTRSVVIEDSVNGVRAAIAAGMTCYGFAGGLSPREDLRSSGAIVFDTMAELRDILLSDD
jgi:beta-phosphoglucomutase-like phosphatase (HAD superfamily)